MSSTPQVESPRIRMYENALSHSQRTDAQVPGHTHVHSTEPESQFELAPFTLDQDVPPLAYDGESATHLQDLTAQEYPNNASAYSDAHTHAHLTGFEFGPASVTSSWDPWLLPVLPLVNDGESATRGFATQQYFPNDAHASSGADRAHVHSTESLFGPGPFQQRVPGPSQAGINPALLEIWESEVYPNYGSQLSPPGPVLAQSTGGAAPEQSPLAAQLTSAQEAEPRRHRSAVQLEYPRRCPWENCVTVTNFKRSQELERHVREVHEVHGPPPKCPFCPRTWKRAYHMKNHMINDHHEELAEDVFERILVLEGKKFFAFVDTIRPPQ